MNLQLNAYFPIKFHQFFYSLAFIGDFECYAAVLWLIANHLYTYPYHIFKTYRFQHLINIIIEQRVFWFFFYTNFKISPFMICARIRFLSRTKKWKIFYNTFISIFEFFVFFFSRTYEAIHFSDAGNKKLWETQIQLDTLFRIKIYCTL